MAIATATALALASTAVGAYGAKTQASAAKKGAQAAQQGTDAAIAEQRRQYDQTRTDQMPWLQAGTGALGQLGALNSGDFSSFRSSPDYQYALDSSLGSLDRYAASRGAYNAGGTDADRMKLAGGLASQNYNNYYNRIAGIAGLGQNSAQNLAGYGAGMANNISGQYNNLANAQASSYQNQANAWGNFANQAGQAGAWWLANRKNPQYGG